MSNNPLSAWRPIIGGMVAALMLVGGCGAEPVRTPTPSSSTTSTTPPPPPVKYSASGWTSCPDIQRELSVDLPPPLAEDKQEGFKSAQRICRFRSDDSTFFLSIQYWESTENVTGIHAGAERAKEDYLGRGQAREKDSGLNLGSDARWASDATTGCTLEVLDENAVVSVGSSNPEDPAYGKTEQCRGRARDVTKRFYAAVQP